MFNEFMKNFRKDHLFSMQQMADRLGVTPKCYCFYEKGRINTQNLVFINKFVDAFIDILSPVELENINEIIKKYKEENSQSLNLFLRKFRKDHRFTQRQIAEKVGISLNNYNKYENIMTNPKRVVFINKFINAFREILTEEDINNLNAIKQKIKDDKTNTEIINIIKSVRLRNSISLREMSSVLGVSRTYINNAELGKWNFSNESILKFYNIYKQLLTNEENIKIYEHLKQNNLLDNSSIKNLNISDTMYNTNYSNIEKANVKTLNK